MVSVFIAWSHVPYLIQRVSDEETRTNRNLERGEYSRLTSSILPYYFSPTPNGFRIWVTTPAFSFGQGAIPDYTVFLIAYNPFNIIPFAISQVKRRSDSWAELLGQMWTQCNAAVARYQTGRIWAVGQKGLEICFFQFDPTLFQGQAPRFYNNFGLVIPSNFTEDKLKQYGVKYESCNDNGTSRVALIKWRLDDQSHWPFIDEMFQIISTRPANDSVLQ